MRLIIPGQLLSLNEYIRIERGNRFAAAKVKREQTHLIYYACKKQKLRPIKGAVDIMCWWYCPNIKKDPDNIAYGIKFLLDGLVLADVLENDSWNFVKSITHSFTLDAKNPRILITLSPCIKDQNSIECKP